MWYTSKIKMGDKYMNKTIRSLIMFILGCSFYLTVEIFYRDVSYRWMGVLGGFLFCFGGILNNKFSWKMDLFLQCLIISITTTLCEAIIGNIDYYWLHKNMWNYSNMPFNYLNGKICLPFSAIWFLFGFVIVFVYDAITYYWMHKGDQPEYWIFGKRIWQMPIRRCHIN